jgi:hypothetical protein
MNRRVSKKQHKKYLPDLGIEICQDKHWHSRLVKLSIGDSIAIESSSIPESFYGINKAANLRKLNFEVARVELCSVPVSESSWWEVGEKTIVLAFFPAEFKKLCWYAAIN